MFFNRLGDDRNEIIIDRMGIKKWSVYDVKLIN